MGVSRFQSLYFVFVLLGLLLSSYVLFVYLKTHKNYKTENPIKTFAMEEFTRTSMLMEARELYIKYRKSREGKILRGMLKKLNEVAEALLSYHDINCALNNIINILNSNVVLVKNLYLQIIIGITMLIWGLNK